MTSQGPEIIIKMSLLNVSNDVTGSPEGFSLKDIEVLHFIKKNSKEGHPYYVSRCQYEQLEKHKQWLRLRYPSMVMADKYSDPNAIHRWNRFKREVIKRPNYYKNHFSLTKEKQELLETALDATI